MPVTVGTRQQAVDAIGSLWPPGAGNSETQRVGNVLLVQAIERFGGWKALPDQVLIEMANLSLARESG